VDFLSHENKMACIMVVGPLLLLTNYFFNTNIIHISQNTANN